MSVVGIIAEYNPFHNGHKYQINKIKEITGCDDVIVIMSGNYVQRGYPACAPKYDRSKLAIENGVSLVIELPVIASTSSAEFFASYGVFLLNSLGIVDYICFGAETDNLSALDNIAQTLINETKEYSSLLKEHLGRGISFPAARSAALCGLLGDSDEIKEILSTSNNILAIEYLKALKQLGSSIQPIAVKRNDKGYLSLESNGNYASASAIRKKLTNIHGQYPIEDLVPYNVSQYFMQNPTLIDANMFSDMLFYKLNEDSDYSVYMDISQDFSNRISDNIKSFTSYTAFIDILHSKNYTDTHNSRALLHILLGMAENDTMILKKDFTDLFINILAIDKDKLYLLSSIKNNTSIPLINKFGEFYKNLPIDSDCRRILDININADKIYNYIYSKNTSIYLLDDFRIKHSEKFI